LKLLGIVKKVLGAI
uniref:Eumenine mastoparan-EM2 n=1 Tax=Eumenes micado TaxID=2597558 RepID=MAST2_EUMMI|nr:RecName: Full=Eumenine mastoparan-EM2; Short=EMP-EM2 [Eumenes micado]